MRTSTHLIWIILYLYLYFDMVRTLKTSTHPTVAKSMATSQLWTLLTISDKRWDLIWDFFTFFSLCSYLNKNLSGNLFPFKLVCLPLIWRKHTWLKICARAKKKLFSIYNYLLFFFLLVVWFEQKPTRLKQCARATSKVPQLPRLLGLLQGTLLSRFDSSRVEQGCNFQLQAIIFSNQFTIQSSAESWRGL